MGRDRLGQDITQLKRIYEPEAARNGAVYPAPEARTGVEEMFTKRVYEPEVARNAAAYPAPEAKTGVVA